jgi:predicted nucleic acid-binding protein
MTLLVVDASVVVKWFFPEPSADAARALLDTPTRFAAPDLVFAEVGNTIWKRVRARELDPQSARRMVSDVAKIAIDPVPSRALLKDAAAIAIAAAITVYDAMYVALAVRLRTQLVTADERLHRSLSRSAVIAQHVRMI